MTEAEVWVSIRVVPGGRDAPPIAPGEVVWRFTIKDGRLREIVRNDVRLGFITEVPGSYRIKDIALDGVEGDIGDKIEEAEEVVKG